MAKVEFTDSQKQTKIVNEMFEQDWILQNNVVQYWSINQPIGKEG